MTIETPTFLPVQNRDRESSFGLELGTFIPMSIL